MLIERAFEIDRLDCDNRKKGNPPKVDKFRRVILDQYLSEALFLMELIGITVFSDEKTKKPEKKKNTKISKTPVINTLDMKGKLTIGKRAKNEAIQYLESCGITTGEISSYAVRQTKRPEFWINPKKYVLTKEWYIILNDNVIHELVVLKIPPNSIGMGENNNLGLLVRPDRPEVIDLSIDCGNLIDKRSGFDFSPFVIQRIAY